MFIPIVFAVISSFVAVESNDSIKTYRVNVKVPGGRINEDIIVDSKENTMTVNLGDVSHLNNSFCPSINLHDFEMKKVAIKNIDYGICMIVDTKEYYSDSVEMLNKITMLHYRHEVKDEIMVRARRITHDKMLQIAGEKMADFCRGYKLYVGEKVQKDGMLIAVKNANRRKRRRALGMRGCRWGCLFCLIGQS